jgi:hypothetical protein
MDIAATKRAGIPEIGVVHLIRRRNGLAPFERFLASYREFPAGVPHDLVLIFKGFPFGRGTQSYDRLLAGVPHRRMYLADFGFDLRPYFQAVTMLEHRYLCFLNSFSRILAPDWLAMLHRWASAEGVGVVGATASYQSFSTNIAEREHMLKKMPFVPRLRWRVGHTLGDARPRLVMQRAAAWLFCELGLWDPARYFPAFPNYHVRTNAFMVSRETLARVRIGPVFFKLSAYMFESGRDSLTGQTMRLGLRPLMVARNGEAYEKEDWPLAKTFWQSRQENLLVADNQTDAYENANVEGRIDLSRQAWGSFARPFQG